LIKRLGVVNERFSRRAKIAAELGRCRNQGKPRAPGPDPLPFVIDEEESLVLAIVDFRKVDPGTQRSAELVLLEQRRRPRLEETARRQFVKPQELEQ